MNISQLKRIIQQYLSGHANEKETELIDRWLDDSLSASRQQQPTLRSEQDRQVAWQELQGIISPANRSSKLIWLKRWRVAAAACVILAAGTAVAYQYRYDLQDLVDPVPMEHVSALQFQVKQVILPDSTVVVLNGGSELSYPRRFRGNERRVALNGEAFFDVKKDASASFRIAGPHLQVQVLGTSFIISDSSSITSAKVSVQTGKVAVSAGAGTFSRQLNAREELIYHSQSQDVLVQNISDEPADWISKQMVFNNSTLAIVLDAISTKYGITIKLGDPAVGQTSFTGAFEATDTLQDMLNVISLSYRLKIEKNKDGSIMVR